jgi:hypothetical protein
MNYSDKGATLSACGLYRYRLWRDWADPLLQPGYFKRQPVVFLMCNPSTADGLVDDRTIRRCARFAEVWGYGRMEALNLWAWRSTDVRGLAQAVDPIGPGNDAHIMQMLDVAGLVVAAWGALAKVPRSVRALERAAHVIELARSRADLYVLQLTPTGGEPQHPLFVPGDARPSLWRERST